MWNSLLSPYRRPLGLALAFGLAAAVLVLAGPLFMLQVYDRVLPSRSMPTLGMLFAGAFVCYVAVSFLDVAVNRILAAIAADYEQRRGSVLAEVLIRLSATPGASQNAAALRDVQIVSQFLSGSGTKALLDLPWFPFYVFVIFLMHPVLGSLALAGALSLLALAWISDRALRRPTSLASARARHASHLMDMVQRNAEAVHGMGMTGSLVARWRQLADRAVDGQTESAERAARFSATIKWLRQALQTGMLAVGAWLVIAQGATPGILIAATIVLARALGPVEQLVSGWRGLSEALGAHARVARTLQAPAPPKAATALPTPTGSVEAEGVFFGLPGADHPIINGIGFRFRPGESIAVVGASASGKSTLARLIVGIWTPTRGSVSLDGAPVSLWDRATLATHVGYLPQSVDLLPGTVAQNIARVGDADPDRIADAARLARCHDLILSLPAGFDTEIGDHAEHLSFGQRQRIALARAVYGSPKLVVLDEPNANLDAEGEQALMACMRDLKTRGITVILIAHKASVLSSSERLMVLHRGRIQALGPTMQVLRQLATRSAPRRAAPPRTTPVAAEHPPAQMEASAA